MILDATKSVEATMQPEDQEEEEEEEGEWEEETRGPGKGRKRLIRALKEDEGMDEERRVKKMMKEMEDNMRKEWATELEKLKGEQRRNDQTLSDKRRRHSSADEHSETEEERKKRREAGWNRTKEEARPMGERNRNMATKEQCWRCGGGGHRAFACDLPCKFCGKAGHAENRCFRNPQAINPIQYGPYVPPQQARIPAGQMQARRGYAPRQEYPRRGGYQERPERQRRPQQENARDLGQKRLIRQLIHEVRQPPPLPRLPAPPQPGNVDAA